MVRCTVYLDQADWQHFRVACLVRQTSASKELGRLMAEQLARWEQEEHHEHTPPNVSTDEQRP